VKKRIESQLFRLGVPVFYPAYVVSPYSLAVHIDPLAEANGKGY
jgi:hypothetical protein